jgi:hypothetical protein
MKNIIRDQKQTGGAKIQHLMSPNFALILCPPECNDPPMILPSTNLPTLPHIFAPFFLPALCSLRPSAAIKIQNSKWQAQLGLKNPFLSLTPSFRPERFQGSKVWQPLTAISTVSTVSLSPPGIQTSGCDSSLSSFCPFRPCGFGLSRLRIKLPRQESNKNAQ